MPNYIVIQVPSDKSLADLANHQNQATKPHETLNSLINLLAGLNGTKSGTIQVLTSDTQTSLSTSGTGSALNTFTF